MKKSLLLLLSLGAMAALGGCYKTTLTGFSPDGGPGTQVKSYAHTAVWGLVPLNDVNVAKDCGDKGVWMVTSKANIVSLLAANITFGLYIPMVAEVTCKA
jgi:hypothetical protein